ncbi:MAG: 50S ribosomal protein L29 [Bacteroidota bacterium]
MKKVDLSQLSDSDLNEKLNDEKNIYSKMNFNHVISPVENPIHIRITRKTIARMMTEIRRREIASKKNSK